MKAIRGKAQKAVMKALQHGKRELTDLARDPAFRGVHFAKIMKSVESLAKAGHVKFDPRTQVVALAETTDAFAGDKFDALLEAIGSDAGSQPEPLEEGAKVTKQLVKALQRMTSQNDHTGALRLIASRVLNDKKLSQALSGLEAMRDLFHGLSGGLSEVRDKLYNMTMARAKAKLSEEDYKAVHGAL